VRLDRDIPALGACPNPPTVSTAPMKLRDGDTLSYASDDHTASVVAHDARFVGEPLGLTVSEGSSLIHGATISESQGKT